MILQNAVLLGKTLIYSGIISSAAYAYYDWDHTSQIIGRGISDVIVYTAKNENVQKNIADLAANTVIEVMNDPNFQKKVTDTLAKTIEQNSETLVNATEKILQNPSVRNESLKLSEWVVGKLSVSDYIQENVASLLLLALNLDWTKDQAAYWINYILSRDDTGEQTRSVLRESVFKNSEVRKDASNLASGVIKEALNDNETISSGKAYLLNILRDHHVQMNASKAVWNVVKGSIPFIGWKEKAVSHPIEGKANAPTDKNTK